MCQGLPYLWQRCEMVPRLCRQPGLLVPVKRPAHSEVCLAARAKKKKKVPRRRTAVGW